MLPSHPQSTERRTAPGQSVEPGTWWRLTDDAHELHGWPWAEGMSCPEHGLILLVEEVRIIDGEIHTLALHGHPGWKRPEQVKLLAEAFFSAFAPVPDGEQLRALELAALMDRISQAGKSIGDIPADQVLLANAREEQSREGAPDATVDPGLPEAPYLQVPAALLPGGDILATQSRLQGEVEIMRLRQRWVEVRQAAMKAGWDLVNGYQKERAAMSMASISARQAQISTALQQVHSMGLWLGEGISITTLVEGTSAPDGDPLHLMQRMLFLDEEIYTHAMLEDGFTADDMPDLGALLSANPELVERMLPHPRSVVITRIRRKSRDMPFPKDWGEILSQIEKKQADMLIQILVRDGGRVLMITADEETSKAERLFPSRAEIDAIFTERDGYDWKSHERKTRAITPHDIEYSDKRSEHDKRALFYRRFLLILWGAQEREQVFGPFVAPGTNWLEETVQSDRFRFVHDEEEVLSDGRPDVMEWIRQANARAAAGSQLILQGRRAMNEDSAPTAYKHESGRPLATHHPVNSFDHVQAARSGALLIARIPCAKPWDSDDKAVLKPVVLRAADNSILENGFLCLDEISSQDLRYYIASRRNRESYLRWLGLFREALPHVEARETLERDLADAAIATRLVKPEHRDLALQAARAQLQAMRTPAVNPAAARKVVRTVERLRAGPPRGLPENSLLTLDQFGTWRIAAEDPAIAGTGLPAPLLRLVNCGKAGKATLRKEGLITASMAAPLGQVIVRDGRDPEEIAKTWEYSAPGLRAVKDWEEIGKLLDGGRDTRISRFFDTWSRPLDHDLERVFSKSAEISLRPSNRYGDAVILKPCVLLGAVMAPTAEWGRADGFAAFALIASAEPCAAALKAGREEQIRRYANRVFKDGEYNFERLKASREGKDDIRLSAVQLTDSNTLADISRQDAFDRAPAAITPRKIQITGWKRSDTEELELTTLEEILSWADVSSGVSYELGSFIKAATPQARRFIAPAAAAFMAAKGF